MILSAWFSGQRCLGALKIGQETEPLNLPEVYITFVDKRFEKLFVNYRARNFPGTLD
ncbi:exodeoxyribonuclease I [Escherichia coli]|nr:exodeoxyribonuclease I [Escherichia coli]